MSNFSFIQTNFKAGDKVIAVDVSGYPLTKGQKYTIESVRPSHLGVQMVKLIECLTFGELFGGRFIPVKKQSMQTNYHNTRAANGRFTSTEPTRLQRSLAAFNTAPASVTPLKLRPGSLYRVSGGATGRYVGTVKGFATLTVHGKPIAVKVERVKLADKDDVSAYLTDSKENK